MSGDIASWIGDRNNRFMVFKYAVYMLLAFNIYLFSLSGTFTETIDTAAWVVILGLFEWETMTMGAQRGKREKAFLWGLSFLAYGVIVYSCYAYFIEEEWLDFANSLTWILVVAGLEYDVWGDEHYSQGEWMRRNALKGVLYFSLFVFAVMWGIEGEVLDFYDSFLWLLSFMVIELNIFEFEHKRLNV